MATSHSPTTSAMAMVNAATTTGSGIKQQTMLTEALAVECQPRERRDNVRVAKEPDVKEKDRPEQDGSTTIAAPAASAQPATTTISVKSNCGFRSQARDAAWERGEGAARVPVALAMGCTGISVSEVKGY